MQIRNPHIERSTTILVLHLALYKVRSALIVGSGLLAPGCSELSHTHLLYTLSLPPRTNLGVSSVLYIGGLCKCPGANKVTTSGGGMQGHVERYMWHLRGDCVQVRYLEYVCWAFGSVPHNNKTTTPTCLMQGSL